MTPSEIGERTEAAVLAALVAAGKHVLVPFGGQRRYDLAYEEGGRLVKVQCKTGRVRKGAIWFRTHSVIRGSIRDYREDVDFFGVYCHERGEVYLVPVGVVPPRGAHLRLDPARNGQRAGIRWASQFLLVPADPPTGTAEMGRQEILVEVTSEVANQMDATEEGRPNSS